VTHIIHRVEDLTAFVRGLQSEGSSLRDPNSSDCRLQEMAQEIVLRGEELKLALQDLRNSRAELARANTDLEVRVQERTHSLTEKVQELEEFSYSLSHDLRAPLRAMRSFAQILCKDYSDRIGNEGAELLNRIATAAARLDQLIEEVLTLSWISKERVELHPINLETFLRELIRERPAYQSPRLHLAIVVPLLPVRAHEALLNQCFSNLLDNAIKFIKPDTTPHIRIRTEGRMDSVRVWIEDNGIGLAKNDAERIFGMFQRLHSNEAYPGTGIGLTIVKKAVERMGGKVGFESEIGHGSSFWIELPRA